MASSGNPEAQAQAKGYMARRREVENTYDKFLSVLNLYDAKSERGGSAHSARDAAVRGMRAGGADRYIDEGQELHPEMAVVSAVRACDQARRSRWDSRERSSRSSWRRTCRRSFSISPCRKATSTRSRAVRRPTRESPRGCGSSFRRPAARYGLTIGPLAKVRQDGRRRRSAQLAEGDHRRRAVHQGHLRDRRAGVRPAGDGLVQLGRGARHQTAAEHAAESRRSGTSGRSSRSTATGCPIKPTTTCSTSSRRP